MDSVFSVDEIADQFWSPHPPIPLDGGGDDDDDQPSSSSAATTAQSKMMQGMNRSSSEWAFQRFLQEAAAPDRNPQPLLSSSSSTHPPQNDDVVEIKGSRVGVNGNKQHPSNTAGPPPPNIPVDSDAYQAYLKSRLELACAAVALTRASNVKGQASTATAPDNGSQASNSSQLVHQGAKYYTSTPFKVLA